jgi:hypothetical protein
LPKIIKNISYLINMTCYRNTIRRLLKWLALRTSGIGSGTFWQSGRIQIRIQMKKNSFRSATLNGLTMAKLCVCTNLKSTFQILSPHPMSGKIGWDKNKALTTAFLNLSGQFWFDCEYSKIRPIRVARAHWTISLLLCAAAAHLFSGHTQNAPLSHRLPCAIIIGMIENHRYLMSRLPFQGFYLWRHILSTAPPFMVVTFRNTSCPPPPQLLLHKRAALSTNSKGTQSVRSRQNLNSSL